MNARTGNDALHETEARRLELLQAIGQKRRSFVIAYLTTSRTGLGSQPSSIDGDDMLIMEPHVRAAVSKGATNVDLFVVTLGGDSVAPWGIVAMIREYMKSGGLRVILPSFAYSAGTGISLGADELVMGPGSILGPADTQFDWVSGSQVRRASASDFQGFLDFVAGQGLQGRTVREKVVGWFVHGMDAAAVGGLHRRWRENRRKVMKLLTARRSALSDAHNRRIADFVLYGVGNHGQSIRRTEARENGISFITDIEKTGIEREVAELYHCYEDILRLSVPHARASANLPASGNPDVIRREGDERDFDVYGAHLSETPVAIIESQYETNPAYVAYGLRHWNDVPPVPALSQGAPPGVPISLHPPERPTGLTWIAMRRAR